MVRLSVAAMIAIVVLIGAANAAKAQRDRDLGVVVIGPAATLEALARGVERGVDREKWQPRRLKEADLIARLEGCSASEPRCIAGALGDGGPARLMLVRLRADAGAGRIEGRLFERGSAEIAALTQRYCKECSAAEVGDLGAEVARELLKSYAWKTSPATHLRVIVSPADADVFIDQLAVGHGGMHPVAPGDHVVEARRDGHQPGSQTVSAIEGQTTPVEITLSVDRSAGGRPAWRRLGPWIVAALGVGGVGLGVGYFGIDQDARSDAGENPFSRDARAYGIVSTSAGAALIAGGVLWWWLDRDAPEVAVSLSESGGTVSWTVDF